MKQTRNALTVASAAVIAGSSQAYGQIINLTLPSNITGQAQSTSVVTEYYNIALGTTSTTQSPGDDFAFSYFNGFHNADPAKPTEFFTGVYGLKPGNLPAAYYVPTYVSSYAYAVPVGSKIGADTLTFQQAGRNPTYLSLTYGGTSYGQQQADTKEYLGFQFKDSLGNLHDGYFELESDSYAGPGSPGGLIFLGGAYNSATDTGDGTADIEAGQVAAAPEPGTVSSLLLGAAALGGVGLMRRRRISV